jgi:tetratricopeptide (TPR) repeat protein
VLPIYIYPGQDKAKSTFPDFDKAIKKSSLCIQRHAIKDGKGGELASAGKWIDNNWINIGISHFYKREFFSAIEAFEYVIRTYNKSDDKYTAMLWLIKANNEIGSVSSSEPIISLLKNAKGVPLSIKNEFPIVQADYYLRRGQNTEAYSKLMETVRNNDLFSGVSKKRRSRYAFIVAQLLEQAKDNRRAVEYYKKTIQLKPSYEMVFYSKIKIARLMDIKEGNSDKIKKDLMKMTKEFKNSDYYDVIFFTLGEIEEREKNIPQAINYFKRSVQTSTVNPNQKALSYLKLAEINFELTNYVPAEAYYDSAVVTLPKDHPDYKNIEARKKTLETLVKNIRTISREDSLQRIAKMSDGDRTLYIEKLIENIKRDEERKQREAEAAKNALANTGSAAANGGASLPGFGDAVASFPFYNPNTVALGIAEFTKKWGNRKLEDNWRRSNKAITLDDNTSGGKEPGTDPQKKNNGPTLTKEMFLKDLPLNDSLLDVSTKKIIKAYYVIGSIYKEELNNNKKTINTFEELNTRFPDNKYTLNTYYSLYRIYLDEKNQTKAEFYKNKILSEFPDSEFALLIKDPGYAQERSGQVSELEKFYAETFDFYQQENFSESFAKSKEGVAAYGKSKYVSQFEFIKAMSAAHLRGTDSLERDLKLVVAKYPNSEVTPMCNDILLSIKKVKNPELFPEKTNKAPVDTFSIDFDASHFVVAITPDNSNITQALIANLGNFNSTYYSDKKFDITSNIFGNKQIVVIKSFDTAKMAVNYFDNLKNDPEVFKGDVKKEDMQILPILASNLPFLYKKKNSEGYKVFYEDNYKKLNTKN